MRLKSRASSRASSRLGVTAGTAASAATAKQDLLGGREVAAAAAQEHGQVVEHVGRLLHDLRADERRVVEQLHGVRAVGALRLALDEGALELGEHLVRRPGVRV